MVRHGEATCSMPQPNQLVQSGAGSGRDAPPPPPRWEKKVSLRPLCDMCHGSTAQPRLIQCLAWKPAFRKARLRTRPSMLLPGMTRQRAMTLCISLACGSLNPL